jgi:hypothetical protein
VRATRFVGCLVAVASSALIAAPVAQASPDTQVPNGDALWCWGGKGMVGLVTPFCNGEPFPDGTYLRQLGFLQGIGRPLGWNPAFCAAPNGEPVPPGVGGCGVVASSPG